MLLVFDIGNSGVSFGIFDIGGTTPECIMKSRVTSDVRRTRDEYYVWIREILHMYRVDVADIDATAISSVVPTMTNKITDVAKLFTAKKPLIIGPGVHTGLNIRIDVHTQIGADIVANMVAALTRFPAPAVVVDFGTVTTLAVADTNSILIGAIICPGLRTSLDAIVNSASLLYESDFTRPSTLIGKNTADSINSGVINGHVLMIDGFIRDLRQQLCTPPETKLSLIATGGLAEYVTPYCRNKFTVIPALTLDGIAEIYRRNHKE